MAHPFANVREHKVQRSRVSDMTKGYASGGNIGAAIDHRLLKADGGKPRALKLDGKKSGMRLDRFARGGKVKKGKGSTHVNVVVAPQGGHPPPPPFPALMPPVGGTPSLPPGMPPHPPMMPPGAMPPGMGAGMPGLPPGIRKSGGRTYASGGKVADGAAWKEGLRNMTPVQHSDGKNDQSGLGRGKPITYAKGGPVEAFGMGPKLSAGDNGDGRLQKTALQKRSKRP